MTINENDVEFVNPIIDGRIHWQDIIIKQTGQVIGAMGMKDIGFLDAIIEWYQMIVEDTPENRKYDCYDSEDPGQIFIRFDNLEEFLKYFNGSQNIESKRSQRP